ncbi:unnamed protein product [Diamesa serratosioi]
MEAFIYFVFFVLMIYLFFSRILPKLIGWVLINQFQIKIRFGRISMFNTLRNVSIFKNGFEIQIEEICIRSNFFNSDVSKPISIEINDIRINKNIDCDVEQESDIKKSKITDFREKRIPSSVITLFQFVGFHIKNISLVLLNNYCEPSWWLHATTNELYIDGSVVHNSKSLLFSILFNDIQSKILRHNKSNQHSKSSQPCLAELNFGLGFDGTVIANGPLSVESLNISIKNSKVTFHGGLYDFIKDAKHHKETIVLSKKQARHSNIDHVSVLEAGEESNIFQKLSSVIPKSFELKIDQTTIAAVRENSSHDFVANLNLFTLTWKLNSMTTSNLPSICTRLEMNELTIDTLHEKCLHIEQYQVDLNLDKDIVNIYMKLKAFQLIYSHGDIYKWIKKNFISDKLETSTNATSFRENKKVRDNTMLIKDVERLFSHLIVKISAEFLDVSTKFQLNGKISSLNISHMKILLDQLPECRSNVYDSYTLNLLLGKRHWCTELMVESLCWYLDSNFKSINVNNNLKKAHARGSAFYVGVGLTKLCSYGNSVKLDLSVHTLRTEYSKVLSAFVTEACKCIKNYSNLKRKDNQKIKIQHLSLNQRKSSIFHQFFAGKILINIKITDITCFFINVYDLCAFLNFSEISYSSSKDQSYIILECMQLSTVDFAQNYSINNLSEYSTTYINSKLIRLERSAGEHIDTPSHISVYILGDTALMWNANMHMHLHTLSKEIDDFVVQIKEIMDIVKQGNQLKTKLKLNTTFDIEIKEDLVVAIKISERHSMQTYMKNFYATTKDSHYYSIKVIHIHIDNAHTFVIKDIVINSMSELNILTAERKNYENFQLPTNKVWATRIGVFRGVFPYDHDFHDAIKNEFISVYKWLKILHKATKIPFTVDSPLPSDMIIQINEFLLEMSDDPFEVKLRDNYVLLLDEYNESLKRKKTLDQKITELRTQRLLLPAGYLEELNTKLIKKNSEIYIERSKKMYETSARTRLFACIMTDLKIMTMADTSIHGYDNVTRMMQIIDEETPWPEEKLDFSTLWCRCVNIGCTEWKFMLRDYPQPMFHVSSMNMFGHLCGAEQAPHRRAKREIIVEIGAPFGSYTMQRGMTSLKFYHDFDWELDLLAYAFGPCWEPCVAQFNLSFEKISAPSKDPSPPMPFWDKMRLLFHGRLTIIAKQFTILLHASLDPYNTTEEMELTWNNCGIVWANAKIMFKGDLKVWVRTASRYDDCRLLHLPNLKLTFKLNWICLANPNDHHTVVPCAPDKLPEYSSNQVHDSFRAFRSQNVNISISFETKQGSTADVPKLDLFGSTLRWFESLKLILSGITRPTRRGRVFNNVRPRKKQLSRHYRKAHLQMSISKFQVCYWMSHALHRGFQLNGGRVSFSSEHTLAINTIDDNLIHRPKADWSILYMNCELNDAEVWLRSVTNTDKTDSSSESISNSTRDICRDYFLSLAKVSYGREAMISVDERRHKDTPTHKLVIYDLKGAWTKNNRDIAFGLFDSFMKSQKLKSNLATEALKGFRKESNTNANPMKSTGDQNIVPPLSKCKPHQQTSHSISMLKKLVSESDHKFVVFSDDNSTQTTEQQLKGLQACQDNDVTHYNWFISLVNSQVLLKGCETTGYVILSAAKAEIFQRVHRPVWRDSAVVSKTTWVGSLECMQYYATVNSDDNLGVEMAKIMWLTLDNIQENDRNSAISNDYTDTPHLPLMGSGQSVGGVVSVGSSIGESFEKHPNQQLQRIVSRCKCEFFYVSYGETTIDDMSELPALPAPEETMSPWEKQIEPVDAFTLMHHDLDVQTSSVQYSMILDIVNNLLLYVEPQRKEALDKLARKRFELQLHSGEDQKRPIQHLQTEILSLMSHLRCLEKDIHFIAKARVDGEDTQELKIEYNSVQKQIKHCKDMLAFQSDELDMMLSCYKETQLSASNKLAIRKDKPLSIVRCNEICFKHAQWRLTEADGQIGIADLILSNFLYTKNSKSDDSVEHLLELGYIRINNLIPSDTYKVILCPTEIQRDMPVDHKRVLRVFCREKPPVGGISVKEHIEINVVPITIAITKKFYSTMLKFCFPDRDTYVDEIDDNKPSTSKKNSKLKKNTKDSSFYVKIEKDDAEIMRERAKQNKLFIYIKIPQVPVRLSYKGNKEKNLEDITNVYLLVPTLEYHNVTWTWLDLMLAMKNDSKKILLSQVISQKLKMKSPLSLMETAPQEDSDKIKLIFGHRHKLNKP